MAKYPRTAPKIARGGHLEGNFINLHVFSLVVSAEYVDTIRPLFVAAFPELVYDPKPIWMKGEEVSDVWAQTFNAASNERGTFVTLYPAQFEPYTQLVDKLWELGGKLCVNMVAAEIGEATIYNAKVVTNTHWLNSTEPGDSYIFEPYTGYTFKPIPYSSIRPEELRDHYLIAVIPVFNSQPSPVHISHLWGRGNVEQGWDLMHFDCWHDAKAVVYFLDEFFFRNSTEMSNE